MDRNAIRSKKIGTRRLTLLDVSPNRVGGILQFIIRDDRGDGGVFGRFVMKKTLQIEYSITW